MFFRKIICRSNGKEYAYLKLIENYREGGKVKQRVLANLGNLDNLTPDKVESLISGLRKICGIKTSPGRRIAPPPVIDNNPVVAVPATGVSDPYGLIGGTIQLKANKVLRFGEILAIHKIWEILGIQSAINETFAVQDSDLNVALLLELMVMNQIIKPQNKQVISDWYQCLYLPELEGRELLPHHFYRTLDIIALDQDILEKRLIDRIKGRVPLSTDLAFCWLTTGAVAPSPYYELNMSPYGKYFLEDPAEETFVDLGILVSREGMPFGHRTFRNTEDEIEYSKTVNYLTDNFGTKRCIFVGDRNSFINRNLEVMIAQGYEYLARRKLWSQGDFELIKTEAAPGGANYTQINSELWLKEVQRDEIRYLFCYNPQGAEAKRESLREHVDAVESSLKAIEKAKEESLYKSLLRPFNKNAAVFKDEYCLRYFDWNYDKNTNKFSYRRKDDIIEADQSLAGLFILETNTNALGGRELLESYINLAQIGEGFRVIKNFEARPNKLKASLNMEANILVCVLASIVEKSLEQMTRGAGLNLNARQTLQLLEEIKVTVHQLGDKEVKSVTSINKTQGDILRAVGVV